MSIDLLEVIQKNLGYPVLQKIDPNTQEVVVDNRTRDEHKFSQAAIPSILIALYKYSSMDEGAENILHGNIFTNPVATIFEDTEKEFVEKIISYAGISAENAEVKLNAIASEAVRLTRENVAEADGIAGVKKFLAHQRNNVLPYLAETLHMGDILNDTTIDDNTNKMEGPVSSLMQAIGGKFSAPVTDKHNAEKK